MRFVHHSSVRRRAELEARARSMRHGPTASEEVLFRAIRGRWLGVQFRRQVVLLGRYIADFYAAEVRLAVEAQNEKPTPVPEPPPAGRAGAPSVEGRCE